MGEFHVGTNTLGNTLFVSQHPRPQEIFTALDGDLDEPRLVPVPPKYRLTSRDCTLFTSPRDYRLEFVNEPSGVPREWAVPIGSLVVVETAEGGLTLRTRDGKLRMKLLEAFADALSDKVSNSFKVLPPSRRSPRVGIDRLVISRESWSFSPTEMEFAREKDEATRYLEARRWARPHGLPRFVFVSRDSKKAHLRRSGESAPRQRPRRAGAADARCLPRRGTRPRKFAHHPDGDVPDARPRVAAGRGGAALHERVKDGRARPARVPSAFH